MNTDVYGEDRAEELALVALVVERKRLLLARCGVEMREAETLEARLVAVRCGFELSSGVVFSGRVVPNVEGNGENGWR